MRNIGTISALMLGILLTWPDAQAQTYTRTDAIAYEDNLSLWVIGQAKSSTNVNTGLVESRTDYDPATALPIRTYAFGKLQQTLSYNLAAGTQAGTLATVRDGSNLTTMLSDWYRGVPRSIRYADNTTQSAVVNPSGWITQVTDENGFQTNYTYDSMGRMASVVYPTADTVAWNTTTQTFALIGSSEYGIPAGHWRQTVSTGNGHKLTYFDALSRPLLVREYDADNEVGTTRFSRYAYDDEGRVTFASYPGTTSALTTGIWTEYDALGRPTSVSQDSEHGLLITRTEYLSGLRTRVTNPRLLSTTTSFMAYDQPAYDWPVWIQAPEEQETRIERDVFGKPLAITRGDSSP